MADEVKEIKVETTPTLKMNLILLDALAQYMSTDDFNPVSVFAPKEAALIDTIISGVPDETEAEDKETFVMLCQTLREIGLRIINEVRNQNFLEQTAQGESEGSTILQ
jgi:hypothetical protein